MAIKIYKILLNQITSAVLFYRAFKIFLLQFFYYVLIKYEQIKISFIDNLSLTTDTKCSKKLQSIKSIYVSQLKNFFPPNNVCVVLNEEINNEDDVYKTFFIISDLFASVGIKTVTFFSYHGIKNDNNFIQSNKTLILILLISYSRYLKVSTGQAKGKFRVKRFKQ